jgi:membrane fusion protein, multidrug efflux system
MNRWTNRPFFPALAPMAGASLAAVALLVARPAAAQEVDGLSLPWKSVLVSSPVQEIVAEVKVREGDTVTKDQVLARLHDEKEVAELQRAEKIVEKRTFDAKAATALVAERITSREKALETDIELQLARVDVDIAKRKVEEKTVRSPLDGVVVRTLKEEGESADRVEPLFEVINIDQLFLQFYLERRTAASLKPGQKIEFWLSDDTTVRGQATVDFVSPGADPASGLFRIKLLYDNTSQTLRAGVRITAKF